MGARERTYFELTLKGSEELAMRTYRLDAKVRNVLFLIQKGYATIEGILENSIFPRDDVVERLRDLLRGHFVTIQAGAEITQAAGPTTVIKRGGPNTAGPAPPQAAAAPEAEPEEEEDEDPPVYVGF
ncbi:MAG TPA: hypothetical protein VH183_05815 [Burkholderiaceae bacterium]|jgi:hypothetical protein|nr:hypothetical protein [Burkholderiaceae bacterium]